MRKFLLVTLLTAAAALLAVLFVVPAFAQGGEGTIPEGQETWQAMHEACVNGDWQAMIDAMQEMHPDGDMPCLNNGNGGTGGGMMGGDWSGMHGGRGGMMGGGMMGGGGMMSW